MRTETPPLSHNAMVYDRPGKVSVRQVTIETPDPTFGQVLIQLSWSYDQHDYVTPIPDEVPSHMAAPLLCAGPYALSSLRKSRAAPGDWIMVLSAGGGVGHLACQIASRSLGLRVIEFDVPVKEELVRSCGAEAFISLEQSDRVSTVLKLTGGLGAASVLVCTGEDSTYAEALDMLRFNGVAVVVGVQEGRERPIANASPNVFLFKQLSIIGSSVGNYREAVEVMDLARRGIVKAHVTVEPMSNLQSVFERMEAGKLTGKVVLSI